MKVNLKFLIFELISIVIISGLIMAMFSKGVDLANVQLVTVLIFIAIIVPIIFEAKAKNESMLNAKNIVLVGPLIWILLDGLIVRSGIEEFPPEIVLQVFIMIFVFIFTILLSYIIKWPNFFVGIFKVLDYGDNFKKGKLFNTIIVCLFLGLLPLAIWGGGIGKVLAALTSAGRWNAPWLRARFGGPNDYIKSILNYFLIAGLQFCWFYLIFIKSKIHILLLSFIGLWVVFNTGTRSYFLAVLAPLIIMYYFNATNKRKKPIIILFVFTLVILVLMQFQFIIRQASSKEKIADVVKKTYSDVLESPIDYHRDDQFYQLLKYASFVPDQIPYSGEVVILRPFYHAIPRFLWPNKPEGITRFFEEETNSKGVGMATWSASIIGDFYLCQGWLGIIIAGLLMGFLARQFDSLKDMAVRSPAVLFIYSYGIVFLFSSIRSFQIIIEGWYIFILFYFLLKRLKKKERKVVSI